MVEVPAASAIRRTVSSAGPWRSSSSRPASTSRSRSSSGWDAGGIGGVAMEQNVSYNVRYDHARPTRTDHEPGAAGGAAAGGRDGDRGGRGRVVAGATGRARPRCGRRRGRAAGPVEDEDRATRPAAGSPEPLGVVAAGGARLDHPADRPWVCHRAAAVGRRDAGDVAARRRRAHVAAPGGLARAGAAGAAPQDRPHQADPAAGGSAHRGRGGRLPGDLLGGPAGRAAWRQAPLHRLLRHRLVRSLVDAEHGLAGRPDAADRPGRVAPGRRRRRRRARAVARGPHGVRHARPRGLGLHGRLVRRAGLGWRACVGAGGQPRRRAEPAGPFGQRLLDPLPRRRPRPAAARHPRRRGAAGAPARVPGPAGRPRPAGVLVGEVGGPDRAAGHPLVVAAPVPRYLVAQKRWPRTRAMSKEAVLATAITAITPACTGSVTAPPISDPASTSATSRGSLATARAALARFSSPTIGMVSTLIFSPRMLCRSASPIAPRATWPTCAPAPTTMIRLP